MFIALPLIPPLIIHPVVFNVVSIATPSSEVGCLSQIGWISKGQQIERELLGMNETIQLAKNAAANLSSPPRIYSTSGNGTGSWPDQPGSVETSYGTRGIQPPGADFFSGAVPITLTTLVEPDATAGSANVTFQMTWNESNMPKTHSWRFRVSANHQASFLGEQGDDLPPLPM